MAYSIYNTDGTVLVLVAEGDVDDSATGLSLVGKNVNGYGQYINNNFIKLLGNFANSSGSPPSNPIKGQIWYDTTLKGLKVYDTTWKKVSGATVADIQPSNLGTGDLWWDSKNSQMKVIISNRAYVVGPPISSLVGDTGFTIPASTVKDTNNGALQVSLIKNYGQNVGFVSQTRATVNTTDASLYMNTGTVYALAGLNVLGDFQALGQVRTKYYSTSIDIDALMNNVSTATNVTQAPQVLNQNAAICNLLEFLYPVKVSHIYREPGVPFMAEARVLCKYTNPSNGYHVRRFYVAQGTQLYWTDYNTTASGAVLNQVF
jgi:hypothetical protein